MADWTRYRITPLDIPGSFQEGYKTGRLNKAGRMAADGDLEGAYRTAMPYNMDAASGYLKLRDYGEARTNQQKLDAYNRNVSGAIASQDYAAAAKYAAEQGDPDATLKLGNAAQEKATSDYRALIGQGLGAIDAFKAAPPEQAAARWASLVAFAKNAQDKWAGSISDPTQRETALQQSTALFSDLGGEPTPAKVAAFEKILRDAGVRAGLEFKKPNITVQDGGDVLYVLEDGKQVGTLPKGNDPNKRGDGEYPRKDDRPSAALVRKTETDLRKEFVNNSKDFVQVRDAFAQIKKLGQNAGKDPAADIAFLISFMKMLDPASVVREGEFATAQNAAGVPDRIKNFYNSVARGTRMSAAQVADFTRQANAVYEARLEQQQRNRAQFREYALLYGVNPDIAAPDLALPGDAGAADDVPDFIRDARNNIVPNPAKQR